MSAEDYIGAGYPPLSDYAPPPNVIASARVWVVTGTVGEYSDRSWWVACVAPTEAEAKAAVDRLNAVAREYPDPCEFGFDMAKHQPAFEAWKARLTESGDGNASHEVAAYDLTPRYSCCNAPTTSPLAMGGAR